MVAPLELMRMRLLVFPWDKMHMKMVILLCRCVMPLCYVVLGFSWEGVQHSSSLSNIINH